MSGATFTFNPWRGCTKVSRGCANCYAEQQAKRNPEVLGEWGDGGTRPVAADAYWRQPAVWDRKAEKDKVRRRVFCGSMMDFFERREDLQSPRVRAWRVIASCDNLDWLLLTKRPGNIQRMSPGPALGVSFVEGWPHVWFGLSVEGQREADNLIPVLLGVDARIRFLSVEPLLEAVDLQPHLATGGIHWVIVGGESSQGGRCRPFDLEWCESVVEQCRRYKVACFVKQVGSRPVADGLGFKVSSRKGGDMSEWPEFLRVRQFPTGG